MHRVPRSIWAPAVLYIGLLWLVTPLAGAPLPVAEIERLQAADQILKENIAQMEAQTSLGGEFTTYQQTFHAAVPRRYQSLSTPAAVLKAVQAAPLVLLADDHASARSQENTVLILEAMAAGPRPLTLVIEWIDESFQKQVDAFLAGTLTLTELRTRVKYQQLWGFPWKGYGAILTAAKKAKVPVLLTERLRGQHSLSDRDRHIVERIAADRKREPSRRYLVVYGEYHVLGKGHLGDLLVAAGLPKPVVLISDAEAVYWQALRQLRDPDRISFAALGAGLYYICHGSPLDQKVNYRKYLMKLLGWNKTKFTRWVDDADTRPRSSTANRFESLHR